MFPILQLLLCSVFPLRFLLQLSTSVCPPFIHVLQTSFSYSSLRKLDLEVLRKPIIHYTALLPQLTLSITNAPLCLSTCVRLPFIHISQTSFLLLLLYMDSTSKLSGDLFFTALQFFRWASVDLLLFVYYLFTSRKPLFLPSLSTSKLCGDIHCTSFPPVLSVSSTNGPLSFYLSLIRFCLCLCFCLPSVIYGLQTSFISTFLCRFSETYTLRLHLIFIFYFFFFPSTISIRLFL